MNRLFYIAALFTLGAGVFCAVDTKKGFIYKTPGAVGAYVNGNLGIFEGKTTTIKKHPYLVAINYHDYFLCTGVIVDASWVLSLGDCPFGAKPSEFKIIAGFQGENSGKTYKVVKTAIHPKYGHSLFDYDFGLFKIKGKFEWSDKVKKASLHRKKLKPKTKVVIVGWSQTKSGVTMEEGDMELISKKECENILADSGLNLTVTSRMNCIYNKNNTSPCAEDISDPVTLRNNQISQLFSAIPAAEECTTKALPAITADIHAALPWIKKITKSNSRRE